MPEAKIDLSHGKSEDLSGKDLRSIDPLRLAQTAEMLVVRISERFPSAGLSRVAREILALTREANARTQDFMRPVWWWRLVAAAIVIALLFLVSMMATRLNHISVTFATFSELAQGVEAAINDVMFLCIGTFFLVTAETRMRRRRVLSALQELRAIAHIIDLHQLSKDPDLLEGTEPDSNASHIREFSPTQLTHYLDYCSELLALLGKLAALYVQGLNDSELVSSVDEIENLISGLSRKIWQKIMLIHSVR